MAVRAVQNSEETGIDTNPRFPGSAVIHAAKFGAESVNAVQFLKTAPS